MSRSPESSKSPKSPRSPRAKSPLFRKSSCKEDCPGTTGPCNLVGTSPGEQKGDSRKKKATIQDPQEKKKSIVSKCKAKCNKLYTGVGKKEAKPKGGKSFLPKKMVCREDCKGTTGPCILLDRGAQSDTTKSPDRHAETSTSPQDTKIFFAEQGTPQPKTEERKKKRKGRESPSSKSSDVSLKASSSIISEGGKEKKKKKKGRGEGVSPRASKTSTSSKESIKKEKKKKKEPKPSESGSTTIVVPQTPIAASTPQPPSRPGSAEEPKSLKKKPKKSSSGQVSQVGSTDDATRSPGSPKRAKQKSPKEPKDKKKVKGG